MIVLKLGLLLIALQACGVYGDEPPDKIWNMCENELFSLDNCQSRLICYQSKLAKDSWNWKAGNRFRVNSPNASIAYECAENDGSKGWHAVRISNEGIGMVTLDSSFGSLSLTNVSKHPEINIIKELTSGGQSAGEEFQKALRFGAFMIDFDGMPFLIAALELRQSIGKKDTKLCKTKLSPVMPKAQHVDHFGTNWMQIEFPMDIPKFSLNVSISPYWIACASHQRNDKADHIQDNYTKVSEVANQDQFNACSKVPTSSVCNKSLEFYACYKSITNQPHMNKEIAEICQKRLSQAPFVAGFRFRICMHRDAKKQILTFESRLEFSSSVQIINTSLEFQFKSGEVSKLMRYVPFSFTEFGQQPSEIHAESIKEMVLDSIVNEQINGSWSKIIHFIPPLNEALRIFIQAKQGFTKLITRKTNLRPYQDNPNITHPSRCDILGEHCEPIRQILKKVEEMQEWCAPYNPTEICISPGRTPTPEDLKPFTRPPWDNMSFPSTKMSSNDKRTKDPLEADDVIYTKDQAQGQQDYFVEMCAKCRNSSLGKKPRRQKRQHMRNVKIWTKFPIPIKFDTVSLGDKISFAIATISRGVAWISEKTCVDFTFDETNDTKGIQIVDNGKRDRCGDSFMGQFKGWQELSLNCEQMYNGAHELLHALGLQHEHQRRDAYSYIKLNPFDKENAQWTANYGFPYDYGSIMHYPPIMSDHNSYDKITLNRFYQQTIGQTEKPSFKDLAIINYMYCRHKCDDENLCQNGGYPNPRLCTECFCPEGYGGNHCEELQENVECKYKMDGNRELEADWQTRTLDTEIFCSSKKCICIWRITPKDGKKLRIQLKRLEIESQCSHMPCQKSYAKSISKRTKGLEVQDFVARKQLPKWPHIIISARLRYSRGPVKFELTYETDGGKILPSDQCSDPRGLFIQERNPGRSVACVDNMDKPTKEIPCSRRQTFYLCLTPNHYTTVNGHQTNKTRILLECFKREDNPTSYWGYWENKNQDPIHIDDMQCVKYIKPKLFKSAEVEDAFENANGKIGYMVFNL
ncbi:hypothetical protein GPALN_011921 [Globodera pallida]|nr:hypothetical protein GPALN_011921 [Globodera pallida]